MTLSQKLPEVYRTVFPSRAIALLMTIGFADLFVTIALHSRGLIVELNLGSSRVDLQACKLEYSIVSPK